MRREDIIPQPMDTARSTTLTWCSESAQEGSLFDTPQHLWYSRVHRPGRRSGGPACWLRRIIEDGIDHAW